MPSKLALSLLAALMLVWGCGSPKVTHPTFGERGLLKDATPLPQASFDALAAVFTVDGGGGRFGADVASKASPGALSIFASDNDAFAVLRAGCLEEGTRAVFEGYWRYANAVNTGLMRLLVDGVLASELCAGVPLDVPLVLSGSVGTNDEEPDEPVSFSFLRPLTATNGRFFIVSHRGGCRTDDECGASENSLEIVRLAETFGADAVEIDIHLTSDNVPIIYHDGVFSNRLTEGAYCKGPVDEFTLAHVRGLCRLKNGEHVPTLEEMLTTIIDETALKGVWLDVKSKPSLAPTIAIVEQMQAYAAGKDRPIMIIIGLYTSEMVDAYIAADKPDDLTCLVELDPSDLRSTKCQVWAPVWTRGPMPEKVRAVQSRGGGVCYWTLDQREYIDIVLQDSPPNCIVSDRPGLVYHRFNTVGRDPGTPQEPFKGGGKHP
jgi:glycerophosphoryl diester phosphodiesterase